MIKAVLLDCYGTIVEESDDLIAAVAAEMIAKGSRSRCKFSDAEGDLS